MDPIIGTALISAAGALGSGLFGFLGSRNANRVNRDISSENIEAIRAMNNQNIAFQKAENAITREREDNAVQRSALDMQMAGLSKTLAAGNPASSQSLTAPQVQAEKRDFKYENVLKNFNLASAYAEIQNAVSNSKKIEAEADNLKVDTALKNATFDFTVDQARSEARLSSLKSDYQSLENQLYEKYGESKVISEIDNIVASVSEKRSVVSLNNAQVDKIAKEKAHIIASTRKMNREEELLVEDIIYKKLLAEKERFNLRMSEKFGLRTTDSIPHVSGFGFSLPVFNRTGNTSYSNPSYKNGGFVW